MYGKDRGLEAVHDVHAHRRPLEHVLNRHLRLERLERHADIGGRTDRAEQRLGLGRRRNHVGRDAAGNQADRVVRAAEERIGRELEAPQLHQRVEQLLDRGLAELGIRRMGGAARGAQPRPEDPARRAARAGCRSARRSRETGTTRGPGDWRRWPRRSRAPPRRRTAARSSTHRPPAGVRRPRPAPRECLSRRTIRGRRSATPRRGWERMGGRSRSAWTG